MSDPIAGYLYDTTTALVTAHVAQYGGTPPAGQAFVTCADPTAVLVGSPAPPPAVGNMAASDLDLIRGIEDLVAAVGARDALLAKLVPGYAAAGWPTALVAKIAARQAQRALPAPAAATSAPTT